MADSASTTERMSDVESLMWHVESDPFLSSTFANLTYFDRPVDIEHLRRRLWRASRVVPRLRRRVVAGRGAVHPVWADDPDFDLDHHLRWLCLPSGSTEAEARRLAAAIAGEPFDINRPLWQFTVIEGLPDGRSAMVQKIHHTITDGKGGLRMSLEFIDLERDAPEPEPLDDGPPEPREVRSRIEVTRDTITERARRNADAARRLVGSATDRVRDPLLLAGQLGGLPAGTAATVRSLARQFAVLDGHRSPIWSARSLDHRLDTFDVPLDAVADAAHRLGGSVNDLFVAAAAGGAGAYHRRAGSEVAELRMSMPVSTRTANTPGGNAFTPTRVLVPLDPDPVRRFAIVHERLMVTKNERSMALTAQLAGVANLLPHPLLVRLARQQVTTVDFATSNVRAAPFDLYIAGALMTANYPIGPIAGTAWNLTTMSYRGTLNLGLHTDTAAVSDPAALAEDIKASFDELLDAGRPRKRRRAEKTS